MTALPGFTGDLVTCPKCAARGASTEWMPPHCSLSPYGQVEQRQQQTSERHAGGWLLRRCVRCRFPWAEACTDTAPAVVPSQRVGV